MIRERVNIFGAVRPMEPEDQIEVLSIPPEEIGVIKEDPVRRWLTGQELWDKKFERQAHHVERKRKHYEKRFETTIERAREHGLQLHRDSDRPDFGRRATTLSFGSQGDIMHTRRWGTNQCSSVSWSDRINHTSIQVHSIFTTKSLLLVLL
jgi:hypothetical protein